MCALCCPALFSHIRSLSQRLERLGSKLLQSEKEKSELLLRVQEVERELGFRDDEAAGLSKALREAQEEIRRLKQREREGGDVFGDRERALGAELEEAVDRIRVLQGEAEQAKKRGRDEGRAAVESELREMGFAMEEKGTHSIG